MDINIIQNGEEEQSYVVVGAVVCCTMGSTTSQLQLPCSYGLYIKGKAQISIMDYQPHVNVLPFGICAKGMPCSPKLFMPWINGINNKTVGDFPSLANQSITICASGGTIQIQEDGQGGSDVLTGSRKVENNLGFFEQLAKMGREMKAGFNMFLDEIGPATSPEQLAKMGRDLKAGVYKSGREIGPATIHVTRELVGPERFDTVLDSNKPMSERMKAGFDIAAGIAENAGPGKLGKAGKQLSKLGNIPPTHFSGQNNIIPSNSSIAQGTEQASIKATDKSAIETAKKAKSLREQYLGRTPSKNSRTGREVIEQMKQEGKIRTARGGKIEFKASDGKWYNIKEADMAHKTDAVTWWNNTGRYYGAKSKEVREWMLDSKNYYLEHYSINRSQGAKLTERYLPPIK